jgi:hypothetical protein
MTSSKKESSAHSLNEHSHHLDLKAFKEVLQQAYDQVASGKGKQRHGQDKEFHEQPWKLIADHVGPEFLIGQAIKKLMELKSHTVNEINSRSLGVDTAADEAARRWMTDAVGAIVYTVMAVMYRNHTSLAEEDQLSVSFGKFQDD